MKLITEINEDAKFEVIYEGVGETGPKEKAYYITGPFLQTEIVNRNGRKYPKQIVVREVKSYIKNYVDQNRALGELGHPEGPQINYDRASHIIKELKEDGNNFIGKAKILDTPNGKIVKALLDEGVKLSVSSRGLGSLTEVNGVSVVNDDYSLKTAADIVSDPSGPDCFVNGLMEGKEWVMVGGALIEKQINTLKTVVNSATNQKNLQEKKLEAWNLMLRILSER